MALPDVYFLQTLTLSFDGVEFRIFSIIPLTKNSDH